LKADIIRSLQDACSPRGQQRRSFRISKRMRGFKSAVLVQLRFVADRFKMKTVL
jgi:hypothetical protein